MDDGYQPPDAPMDLALIRGQEDGKRAITIAAAGGHAIRLAGPAGAGATLLARALHPLLPPLGAAEAAEVALIHAEAGLRAATDPAPTRRPLCGPPPTITAARLFGSGAGRGRPGAISLAEPSATVAARVAAARQIQAARFAAVPGVTTNAAMGPAEIRAHCALDGAGQALMQAAKE